MAEKSSSIYRIQKLKGAENWATWEQDFKATMVVDGLWAYISGRKRPPIAPTPPQETHTVGSTVERSPPTTEQRDKYDTDLVIYNAAKDTYEEHHEKGMAMLTLSVEAEPRVFIQDFTDSNLAFQMLKTQYGTTDLATLDVSVQELCRTNMSDKGGITQYAAHMKHHISKLRQVQCELPANFIGSLFRMGLPADLNPYVFQLVHSAKSRNVELTIDDMVAALVDQEKRSTYAEETSAADVARKAAWNNKPKDSGNNRGGENNGSNKGKGKGKSGSKDKDHKCGENCTCDHCHSKAHCTDKCKYKHPELRADGWKPHEFKVGLANG